eukprot:1761982-Rhodomonas_salina.6
MKPCEIYSPRPEHRQTQTASHAPSERPGHSISTPLTQLPRVTEEGSALPSGVHGRSAGYLEQRAPLHDREDAPRPVDLQ